MTDKDLAVDHEARRIAALAELKADNATKFIERIDGDIKDGFKKTGEATNRVHHRIDKLLWGVIATLATVVGQALLAKFGLL